MLNSQYINIFEKRSGKTESHFPGNNKFSDTAQATDLII